MVDFYQNLVYVASARLFWLELLELPETFREYQIIITTSVNPVCGLTTQTHSNSTAHILLYIGTCALAFSSTMN